MQLLSENTIALDKSFVLGPMEMNEIYNGWISDEEKLLRLAESDGRHVSYIVRDAITGMIGEWGAYHFMKSYNIPCRTPECGVLDRDKSIWGKDLLTLQDVRITTASGQEVIVDRSISCKAQFLSQTNGIGDVEPSWTFQMETPDRHGDPMLKDAKCNRLLVVSWINNVLDGVEVCYTDWKAAYKKGFRYRPEVSCFWWPDVAGDLDYPRNTDLADKKKCLYYENIWLFSAKVQNDLQ